jgi:hypothetical protein
MSDSLLNRMRTREPNFDRINAALDEHAAGRPATQRTVDTDEPIVVSGSPEMGCLYVTAARRVLAHFRFDERARGGGRPTPVSRCAEHGGNMLGRSAPSHSPEEARVSASSRHGPP